MRIKLVWVLVAFLLLDVLLLGIFLFTKKPSEPEVFRKAPSPFPTASKRKKPRPELVFESQVPGVKIKVVNKKAVEQVLSKSVFENSFV